MFKFGDHLYYKENKPCLFIRYTDKTCDKSIIVFETSTYGLDTVPTSSLTAHKPAEKIVETGAAIHKDLIEDELLKHYNKSVYLPVILPFGNNDLIIWDTTQEINESCSKELTNMINQILKIVFNLNGKVTIYK